MWCSVLQCVALSNLRHRPLVVAVWCSVLHRVAVSCSEQFSASPSASTLHYVAGCYTVSSFRHRPLHSHNTMLQGVAECCRVLQCVTPFLALLHFCPTSMLQCVVMCCSIFHVSLRSCTSAADFSLHYVAAYCSVLHRIAACCTFSCALARQP